MKATSSATTGVCIIDSSAGSASVVQCAPEIFNLWKGDPRCLTSITDWSPVVESNIQRILERSAGNAWLERCVSLMEFCIGAGDPDLRKDIFDEVEDHLQSRVVADDLVSRLLVAPIRHAEPLTELVREALADGNSASASVLEKVRDLQPLLCRFSDRWLSLSDAGFVDVSRTRQEVWQSLSREGRVQRLLELDNWNAFQNEWSAFSLREKTAAARSGVARIGKLLGESLFGGRPAEALSDLVACDQAISEPPQERQSAAQGYLQYRQVLKQIDAIREAVAQGHDGRARLFLRDLLTQQTAQPENHRYAVKSLCNIAKRCAELSRADVEGECLQVAHALDPEDEWTLIQLGDYYKRQGEFDKAIEFLRRALGPQKLVALASIADVHSMRGDYETAISLYRQVDGWESKLAVRTAIADNYRRQGRYALAEEEYDALISRGEESDRLLAGKAEIARHRGDLVEALSIYKELSEIEHLEFQSRNVYLMARAGVLKQLGNLDEAFAIVDSVIQRTPFYLRARALRAAILGLRDESNTALADFDHSARGAVIRDWVHHFYHGLLLLKLNRFQEGRDELVRNLRMAVETGEKRALVKMAAALSLLMVDQTDSAYELVRDLPLTGDEHSDYLSLVLKFHISIAKNDNALIKHYSRELQSRTPTTPELELAVERLVHRDFVAARRLELDALLKAAA
jgi:tetratricopeptide (TPR) repeat protein